MAFLLLAAILATLLGAPAQASAAPSVDTWMPPNVPRVGAPAPFFHDDRVGAMALVEMRQGQTRVWHMSDSGSRAWTAMEIEGASPSHFHSDANWAYDPDGDRVFVIATAGVAQCCSDTMDFHEYLDPWELDLGDAPHWVHILTPGNRPISSQDFAVTYDRTRHRVIVAGGILQGEYRGFEQQVFTLEMSGTPYWASFEPPGPPTAQAPRAAFVDPATDRLYLVGGTDSVDIVTRLHSVPLDFAGPWQWTGGGGDTVLVRYALQYGSPAFDETARRVSIYGRYRSDSTGVWQCDLAQGGDWQRRFWTGPGPRALENVQLACVGKSGRIAAYGGFNFYRTTYDPERYDVFEFTPSPGAWTPIHLSGRGVDPGIGANLLLDTAGHRLIALTASPGGEVEAWPANLDSDLDWEPPLRSNDGPLGRAFASAVLDGPGNRILLFGGQVNDAELSDLWELTYPDGVTPFWRRLFVEGPAPSGRWGASTVYDPKRRRMVIFGGFAGRVLGDTWALELSGTPRWTRLADRGLPPSPRFGASAVYDSRRDGMLVYGGNAGSMDSPLPLGDVTFLSFADGDSWVPIVPRNSAPLGRWLHAGVYDPVRDRMIVLWGRDRTGVRFECAQLELSGTPAWTPYIPAGPATRARYGLAAVYDPVLDVAAMVGGEYGGPAGTDWYLAFAPGVPSSREGPPLALLGMTPNPTNAGVDVAFDLPTAMPVRVRLYDARGRLVKALAERTYPPGRHLVHWDGNGEDGYRPRPGVYFARLALGTTEFTGKVVLLR